MVDWEKEVEDIIKDMEEPEQSLMAKIMVDWTAKVYAETGIWYGD